MDTRRDFIKKAFLLSGAAGVAGVLPASVQRALAIDPRPGSTYLDAEHVVILMQENRSFDHCFGSLKGVRGFKDPRAFILPDKLPVWLQTNAKGETYTPFRLDIQGTNVTWIGDLPHSRSSQVDSYNEGKYDQWLNHKRSRHPKYADVPFTLGHYTRDDLPFNYALADGFTICDQHFCSAMTSTTPNRLFLWTGTIREQQNGSSKANIRNPDMQHGMAKWETFPEKLQEHGIPWKFYQNDIDCGGGYSRDERAWLSNFGCNPTEFFTNFNVKFGPRYVQALKRQTEMLPQEIRELEAKAGALAAGDPAREKIDAALKKKKEVLESAKEGLVKWSQDNFDRLSPKEKELYQRAFVTNTGDPSYREVSTLKYQDGGTAREMTVPKGDVLHQFRQDVKNGQLPAVSWLAGAQNFSDHPSAPWYGAWYVSEVLDILTSNPEVWKKTIFILTYDENDGYFDHAVPFIPPDLSKPETGKVSDGIDTDVEYIRREDELRRGIASKEAREGPVGLGYRVPLIIASPWSRGGQVCSQLFDHTSVLRFLEGFLNHKTGKEVRVDNISRWRRTISGDLTAVFNPFEGASKTKLPFLAKDTFVEKIHRAQFRQEARGSRQLSKEDIAAILRDPATSPLMPSQEPGTKPSCALPYELYADVQLSADKENVEIKLEARNEVFGKRSAGSPFSVYAPGRYRSAAKDWDTSRLWSYAVAAGDTLTDTWPVKGFENDQYHLRVYGPNGFFREFRGERNDPLITVGFEYQRTRPGAGQLTGNVLLKISNADPGKEYTIEIRDHAYKQKTIQKALGKAGSQQVVLDLGKSFGWYDFSIKVGGFELFEKRYAGRVETGKAGYSDPAMG